MNGVSSTPKSSLVPDVRCASMHRPMRSVVFAELNRTARKPLEFAISSPDCENGLAESGASRRPGQLLPDEHANAIGVMANLFREKSALAATGTGETTPAMQSAVRMRKDVPDRASPCDAVRDETENERSQPERKPLRIADLCETVQEDATKSLSEGGGTRTHDQRIKSPLLYQLSYASNDSSFFPYRVLRS
jgi:hypothetical protein